MNSGWTPGIRFRNDEDQPAASLGGQHSRGVFLLAETEQTERAVGCFG